LGKKKDWLGRRRSWKRGYEIRGPRSWGVEVLGEKGKKAGYLAGAAGSRPHEKAEKKGEDLTNSERGTLYCVEKGMKN